ncbi:MAG: hypothetical protein AB1649_31470 [Chloroflexota bacterium]
MPAGNYTKSAALSQGRFVEAVMPRAREVARTVWRDIESAMPYERPEARRGHRAVLRQIVDGGGQRTAISYQPSAVLRHGGNPKPPGPPQPGGRPPSNTIQVYGGP